MAAKWWEKTVEYAFVKNAEFLSVSPLDGDHEQAGDAILRNEKGNYYLIEFKEKSSNKKDEIDKYVKKDKDDKKTAGLVLYYFKFREYLLDFIDEKKHKLKLKEFLLLSKFIFEEYLSEDYKNVLKNRFCKKDIKAYQVDEYWLNLCSDEERKFIKEQHII